MKRKKSICDNETKVYNVYKKAQAIGYRTFVGCKELRMIVLPKSCTILTEKAILDCPQLNTLVFKSQELHGDRASTWDLTWQNVITGCPKLHDIYLFAEDPEKVDFGIFEDLENIGNITLLVPCFCAQKYRNYEVEYTNIYNHYDKKKEKSWQRFKRIEEFDPVDFFEEDL